jgi:predicted phage terminase large subunit-like protein
MLARYRLPNGEYTRIGRQELLGEILDANEGALWRRGDIRYEAAPKKLDRVVVGVDPAMSCTAASDETGIVVVGESCGRLYVLEDLSGRYTPTEWATTVIAATERYPGSSIVAEKNQGGVLVEATIRTLAPRCAYKGVHASKGKYARAEPIVALYEQGKVSHVAPFEQLEKQMLTLSLRSPDRMDALVYACTALAEGSETSARGILQWARSRS